MNIQIKNIFERVWTRTGQNIFGWGIFTGIWLYYVPIGSAYPAGWYWLFRFIIFSLVIGLCYFNNLLLIPALLIKKKYTLYVLLIICATYLVGFAFNITLKIMGMYFPKIEIGEVSFLMTDIPKGWSIIALWQGGVNHFFFIIDFVIIFIMAFYIRRYATQEKQIEEAHKKQLETELTFLKGQMNPHFLFNNLNNLYGLALKKSENTPGAILKLSSILRYLLYESDADRVSFEKEKEVMNAYIDLELLRLSNIENLHFTIDSDGVYNIPPLLWMPVLENVFKHATRVITDNYYIEYRFEIQKNAINIYSKNNYKTNGPKEKNGGIGLENLKKRLALLFPGKHNIVTSHDDEYFVTEVKINLG